MPLDSKHTEASFFVKFDRYVTLTTRSGACISWFGDNIIFVDSDNNDMTDYFTRCICTQGNYSRYPSLEGIKDTLCNNFRTLKCLEMVRKVGPCAQKGGHRDAFVSVRCKLPSGGFRGGSWGSMEPPFGLDLVQRSTGDRLTGTPCLGKELRNQLLWLTSACLSKAIDRKTRDWQVGQEVSLKNARKWAWFSAKVGVAPNFRARFVRNTITESPFNKSCIRHCCLMFTSQTTEPLGKPEAR